MKETNKMKKLMIAAAIVCAAALVQAASVDWKSGTTYYAADATGKFSTDTADKAGSTGKPTVSAALYGIDKGTYELWLGALTTDIATGSKTILDGVSDMSALKEGSFSKGASKLTDTRSISSATPQNPVDLYSAIIYTYTDANGKDWYIANVGTKHFEADSAGALDNLALTVGGTGGGTAITGWQTAAVPEPTSGLLLLLGVAGLALRRRRA